MKIDVIINQIDLKSFALPQFQRGYVWNRDQVRKLMRSLYRRYPIGSLLVWLTKTENASVKGNANLPQGTVRLILDGQQRITTLYGIIRGSPPDFFDGNENTFKGLYFNIEDEVFEFYAPMKMDGNNKWIDVTDLMKMGVGEYMKRIVAAPEFKGDINKYIDRVNTLYSIQKIDVHIEEVAGDDKTIDVVVDIFNQVNSGGTTLSKGDLALAKICAEWSDARDELKKRLEKWRGSEYNFKTEWLLRCTNATLTGESYFSALENIDAPTFKNGLIETEKHVDTLLNTISDRLGLDHNRVLGSQYSFPLMVRYLHNNGGRFKDHKDRDKFLYWYIHTTLWGRYSAATESVLAQDLGVIKNNDTAIDDLISHLRQKRGTLKIHADDFKGWSLGARFYPLLYMMTRVCKARDWDTGNELSKHALGKASQLDIHHIFPKAKLYASKLYKKNEVNSLANFTFLTHDTNLLISDKLPLEAWDSNESLFHHFMKKNPGVLESHWIPLDEDLWKIENYPKFLAVRQEMLAEAANTFLESLVGVSSMDVGHQVKERLVPGGVMDEEDERTLEECNSWIANNGLPLGEMMYELTDPNGDAVAILDLAWPEGLQSGYSQPVALLINEDRRVQEIANQAGFRYFNNVKAFKSYVENKILGLNGT